MKDSAFWIKPRIRLGDALMDFARPRVMGILNHTEDSFFSDSRVGNDTELLHLAEKMVLEGVDILDIGASSTRPGADPVPADTERDILARAVRAVHREFPEIPISADTYRAKSAMAALESGAQMINDISGGSMDNDMFATVASANVPYVLMHMRGTPKTMNSKAVYRDVVNESVLELSKKLQTLRTMGVPDIVIDPGFGFAKTAAQNFVLLARLKEFSIFDTPLMVGLSRKSMVWRTLNTTPDKALNGTTALHMTALQNGANILRTHDVREAQEVIALYKALMGESQ